MSRYKGYNDDYKKGDLGFPSVFIPEDQKDEQYHKEWAKAMYSRWYSGQCAIPNSKQVDIDRLREYGRAEQPVELYLKNDGVRSNTSTLGTDGYSAKKWLFDGKDGMDLRIISVAPKVKSMIKSYLMNIREDAVIECIDPVSASEKEKEKYKLLFYAQNQQFIEGYMKQAGMQPDSFDFLPDSISELEMFEQAGGFKQNNAKTMEMLVHHSIEMSGYEHDLELDLYDDLLDLGIAVTKKYLDPEDLKFKDKYIDPKYLVVQHSTHNDFRDIDWVGHVEFYTIGQLRVFMPELTEEDFRQIASSYRGLLDNPGQMPKRGVIDNGSSSDVNKWSVAVFEGEWKDTEVREAVFYDNQRGKTSELPVTDETVRDLGARKRYVKSNLQKLRQCSWVVGTEFCFDSGMVNMQDRPAKNKVISNYHIRALGDMSLMAQMMPVLDDLMISYIRWQDARANAVKDGYALNLSMLKTIGQGDDKLDIWNILKLWKERGLLLYQYSLEGDYKGGAALPIERLPNTLLDEINEFVTAWNHALKMMEDITGINALILGAAPDPNAPVTTQKLSVASSANAIKPLGMAMSDIKRKSAQSFMRRFVLACKVRKDIIHSYDGIVDRKSIESLLEASRSMADYGMTFVIRPTDAQKAELYKTIDISMQNRREGRPGLDTQTGLAAKEWLDSGVNLKFIRFYVGAMEKRIAKKDMEDRERMIKIQSEENAKNAQKAAQADAQRSQMEIQGKGALNQQEADNNLVKTLVDKDETVADQVARKLGLKPEANPMLNNQNSPV